MKRFRDIAVWNTVNSILETAASIYFDEIFAQNLLSKNWILLRLLFKGGFYLRAASNTDDTVHRKIRLLHVWIQNVKKRKDTPYSTWSIISDGKRRLWITDKSLLEKDVYYILGSIARKRILLQKSIGIFWQLLYFGVWNWRAQFVSIL